MIYRATFAHKLITFFMIMLGIFLSGGTSRAIVVDRHASPKQRPSAAGADARVFLYASNGAKVLRYNGVTGALIDSITPAFADPGGDLDFAFGPDGNFYVTNGVEVLRYSGTTGVLMGTFTDLRQHGFVYAPHLTFGPDGHLYVGGQFSGAASNVARFDGKIGAFTDGFTLLPSKVARFDSRTGAFIDDFIPQLAGQPSYIATVVFGPDGKLYLGCSDGDHAYVLRYNETTGAFIDTFIPSSSRLDPFFNGMAFGPDGHLYIPWGSQVWRYHGRTGVFIDAFVSKDNGGLTAADDLTFGPDSNLYVVRQDNDQVLRYDGKTGVFIDAFTASRDDGIHGPKALTFRGTLLPLWLPVVMAP